MLYSEATLRRMLVVNGAIADFPRWETPRTAKSELYSQQQQQQQTPPWHLLSGVVPAAVDDALYCTRSILRRWPVASTSPRPSVAFVGKAVIDVVFISSLVCFACEKEQKRGSRESHSSLVISDTMRDTRSASHRGARFSRRCTDRECGIV
jgi:hypothetical protein